ncbi:sortase domain-containing protein [Nocardioides montaniterrae]
MSSSYSRTHRIAAYGFLACLALMLVAGLINGAKGSRPAEAEPAPEPTGSAAPSSSAPLPASPPTRLRIPRLHLDVRVVRLGAAAGGHDLALPPLRAAGWDATSVTPGEAGVSVVAGFIERRVGEPGALEQLHRLGAGDRIVVRRRDGAAVRYRVTKIAFYPRGKLPATQVFASVGRPELRLVSVGGPLHRGDPIGNAVVFATRAG